MCIVCNDVLVIVSWYTIHRVDNIVIDVIDK